MADDPRLRALKDVSALLKDLRLSALRKAEAERADLRARIETLATRPTPPQDLSPQVAAEISLRYDRWADLRRREIEAALKQKSAECERLAAEARVAMGRDGALAKVLAKGAPKGAGR